MSRKAMLSRIALGAALAAAVLVGSGAALTSGAAFYWSSFEAEQAIEKSDWGDARNVGSVDCRGVGAFQKRYGQFLFKRFRCELEDPDYERIGFVTVYTTGPESWKPANFIKPRCA